MREILFRGKRIDNGKWVHGDLYHCPNASVNINTHKQGQPWLGYSVIPETVGQYTGLTDKNGKKIFEGDIVHAIFKSNYVGAPNTDFGNGVVEYCGTYYEMASFRINSIGEPGYRIFTASLEVKVIGNIHDNPELMKGELLCKD